MEKFWANFKGRGIQKNFFVSLQGGPLSFQNFFFSEKPKKLIRHFIRLIFDKFLNVRKSSMISPRYRSAHQKWVRYHYWLTSTKSWFFDFKVLVHKIFNFFFLQFLNQESYILAYFWRLARFCVSKFLKCTFLSFYVAILRKSLNKSNFFRFKANIGPFEVFRHAKSC